MRKAGCAHEGGEGFEIGGNAWESVHSLKVFMMAPSIISERWRRMLQNPRGRI